VQEASVAVDPKVEADAHVFNSRRPLRESRRPGKRTGNSRFEVVCEHADSVTLQPFGVMSGGQRCPEGAGKSQPD